MRTKFIDAMRLSWLSAILLICGCSQQSATPTASSAVEAEPPTTEVEVAAVEPIEFGDPIQLVTDEGPIRVEEPGYASPCWADVDQDGNKDLLVGQFSGGKIRVYKHLGDLKFASGEWLEAGGEVAEVPGVW